MKIISLIREIKEDKMKNKKDGVVLKVRKHNMVNHQKN
jgi:hypothetical protein